MRGPEVTVSLGKLKKTFQREMARNPAKTWTLLALLPVAGYFIFPLFWKGSGNKPQSLIAPSAVAAVVVPTLPATTSSPNTFRWQEVAGWISQDIRMKSASAEGLRNPFEKIITPEELARQAALEAKEKEPEAASLGPEDLRLQLNATIIGQEKRLATINGRLYAEGATVQINASDAGSAAVVEPFVLQRVTKNYVLLERQGKVFPLQMDGGPGKPGPANFSPVEN